MPVSQYTTGEKYWRLYAQVCDGKIDATALGQYTPSPLPIISSLKARIAILTSMWKEVLRISISKSTDVLQLEDRKSKAE
jgi:hypothetical protein